MGQDNLSDDQDERMRDGEDDWQLQGRRQEEAGEGGEQQVEEDGEEAEVKDEESPKAHFFHVYRSPVHDLATARGRVDAANLILAVVGYDSEGGH